MQQRKVVSATMLGSPARTPLLTVKSHVVTQAAGFTSTPSVKRDLEGSRSLVRTLPERELNGITLDDGR